jgi:hypothetical protein
MTVLEPYSYLTRVCTLITSACSDGRALLLEYLI